MMYHRDDEDRAVSDLAKRMERAQEPKPVPAWLVKKNMLKSAALPELVAVCQEALAKLGPNGYFPDLGFPLTERMKRAVEAALQ